MSLADIYDRTRTILYGQGLGEKPALRVSASNADESVSGDLVTFTLNSGEGAKVKPGNVLAISDAQNRNFAYVVYVTSISTDTITGVNGYLGSPTISGSDSGDVDSKVWEQNPIVTSHEVFEAIDAVIANMLWPYVYDVVTDTISSPDITYGMESLPAEVEYIISAWQKVGGQEYLIPVSRQPYDVHTDLAANGRLATFDWLNGSTGYYTYMAKFTEADEADTELTHLIALGAAALLMGASISETSFSTTKKDNIEAAGQRGSVADRLMRDFMTLRQQMSLEQVRHLPNKIVVDRG